MVDSVTCPRCGKCFVPDAADAMLAGMCPHCLASAALGDTRPPEVTQSPATRIEPMRPPLKPGASFRGFEVQGILGQGGMGIVYKARQVSLSRTVALKLLSPQFAASEEFALRFDREAKVLASLNHPHVIQVHDFGKEQDLLFLVTEYVEGPTLESILDKKRPIDLAWFLGILRDVTKGLARIHEAGLVHRDIKPANILISKDGTAKISDFGLAVESEDAQKLTQSGMFVGTPHYVSPEHVQGKKVDGRSDLYSLGVILYQGVAGRPPFVAPSATAILMKHVNEPPPPLYKLAPHAPKGVQEIVRKLLAKNPAARHETAAALLRDLERALEEAKSPRPPTPTARKSAGEIRITEVAEPTPKKKPWIWVGAAVAAAAVVAILIGVSGGKREEPQELPVAVVPPKKQTTSGPAEVKREPEKPQETPAAPPQVPNPPPSIGPVEKKPERPVQLSTQEKRRQLDHFLYIINLAGVGAAYCDLKGSVAEAAQLRQTMKDNREKLDALVAGLKSEGQNPFVDDTLQLDDRIVAFENQKMETLGKEGSLALLGTFVAQVRGGSKARIGIAREGKEFVIRFDERPTDLLTIIQVCGLIPGQTLTAKEEALTKPPETPVAPVPVPAVNPAPVPVPVAAPPPAPKRPAVPDPAVQKEAEKTIREIFKAEYAKKAPADVRTLARKLLQQGSELEGDAAPRYVMLRDARDFAAQCGDLETALKAADALGRSFDLEGVSSKAAVLAKMAPQARGTDALSGIARAYVALLEEGIATGQYEAASGAASKGEAAARGANDALLLGRVQTLGRDLAFLQKESSAIKSSLKTLEQKPDDPAANLAAGRFTCLAAGDWARGLPLLAKGGDAGLKAIAEKELSDPADAAGQAALGDGWWSLAEKERTPEYKKRIQARAVKWYMSALPGLTGIARLQTENRLKLVGGLLLPASIQTRRTELVGGTGGAPYEDLSKEGGLLVGIRMAWIDQGMAVLQAVQPLFSSGSGLQEGLIRGKIAGGFKEVLAKPGYAVGGVSARGTNRVHGIKVMFMKISGIALDPRDTYESEWFGDRGPQEVKLGGDGTYVLGLCGGAFEIVDSIGLVLLRRPEPVAAAAPAASPKGEVELLSLVDPKKDSVTGEWAFQGPVLASPMGTYARVHIPYEPPEEFDLSFRVEKKQGTSLLVGLGGRAHAMVTLDGCGGTASGIEAIDGKRVENNDSTWKGVLFAQGRKSSVLISVRKGAIAVTVDDKKVVDWKGAMSRLSMPADWATQDARALWLGSWDSVFMFEGISLVPVSGPGTILRKPAATVGQAKGTVDLLALIDPAKDSLAGTFKREGDALLTPADIPWSRVQILYAPPTEYDLTLVVERKVGGDSLEIGPVWGGRPCTVVIDGRGPNRVDVSGIDFIDNKPFFENSSTNQGPFLHKNKPSTVVVSIRKAGLSVSVDGNRIIDWKGDPSRLGVADGWKVPEKNALMLGGYCTQFLIKQMVLTPVSGQGKKLR